MRYKIIYYLNGIVNTIFLKDDNIQYTHTVIVKHRGKVENIYVK